MTAVDFLANLQSGELADDIQRAFTECASATIEQEEKSTLEIKLEFVLGKSGQLAVIGTCQKKIAPEKRAQLVFFDAAGVPTTEDPQAKFDFESPEIVAPGGDDDE